MIVLISYPDDRIQNEKAVVKELMTAFPLTRFHLRKPTYSQKEFELYLSDFDKETRMRMVVHSIQLENQFSLLGLHCKAHEQTLVNQNPQIISSSFHSKEEALKRQKNFQFFFCSPLFESISKPGYKPTEPWDISNESPEFRNKAIALGGIKLENLETCLQKGFKNIALLGSIWENPDPMLTFAQITNQWEELVQSV
jgi:thiamine-phosphate pyrophosphorylase